MRLALAGVFLPLLTACNPESEALRVNPTELELRFDGEGALVTFDVAGIEEEKEKLKHESWTLMRIYGHIWTPVLQEDGTMANEDWRIFSALADFSAEAPGEFRVGIAPEGWEQGGENYSSAGAISPFPQGALAPGDLVRVGIEALSPADSLHRVSLAEAEQNTVPEQ